MLPEGEVSGVLKSAWASTHTTPVLPATAILESVPIETEWSPPRKIGNAPPATTSRAAAAVLSQTSRMDRRCGIPLFSAPPASIISGIGTPTLPRSETAYPSPSSTSLSRA